MEKFYQRIKPWQLLLMTMLSSIWGGGVLTARVLKSKGLIRSPQIVLMLSIVAGVPLLAGLTIVPKPWMLLSGITLLLNLMVGILFLVTLSRAPVPLSEPTEFEKGTPASAIWGALGGSLISSYLVGAIGYFYHLSLDYFFSTSFPTLFGQTSLYTTLTFSSLDVSIIGFIAGGVIGAKYRNITLSRILMALTGGLVAYFLMDFFQFVLIKIPLFYSTKVTESGTDYALLYPLMWLSRFIVSLFFTFAFLSIQDKRRVTAFKGSIVAVVVALATTLNIVILTGRGSFALLSLGEYFEKQNNWPMAKRLYHISLKQRATGPIGSYLQFRIALLHRKSNETESAKQAFNNIITKFGDREEYVHHSMEFLNALEKSKPGDERYTLPGVETKTEFKSAYCVPNSLSLVLRYIGFPLSAKTIGQEITQLDIGTRLQEFFWYIHSKELTPLFLPLSDLATIRGILKKNLPVLLLIPKHMLAVFGYDEAMSSLVTYDTSKSDLWLDQSIYDLVPPWKSMYAPLGLILNADGQKKFKSQDLEILKNQSLAFLHYYLHFDYSDSDDLLYKKTAYQHLARAMELAPNLFFIAARMYAVPLWGTSFREDMRRNYDLGALAKSGMEFCRYQFSNDDTLMYVTLMLVDQNKLDWASRYLETWLYDNKENRSTYLPALLAYISYLQGRMDKVITYLAPLNGEGQFALATAYEMKKAYQSAFNEYGNVLQSDNYSFPQKRLAMERLNQLKDLVKDKKAFLQAAEFYLADFPYDQAILTSYVQEIQRVLAEDASLPADIKNEYKRKRNQSLKYKELTVD